MCCGKMARLPGERERKILTTGDISVDLDKENREKKEIKRKEVINHVNFTDNNYQ